MKTNFLGAASPARRRGRTRYHRQGGSVSIAPNVDRFKSRKLSRSVASAVRHRQGIQTTTKETLHPPPLFWPPDRTCSSSWCLTRETMTRCEAEKWALSESWRPGTTCEARNRPSQKFNNSGGLSDSRAEPPKQGRDTAVSRRLIHRDDVTATVCRGQSRRL